MLLLSAANSTSSAATPMAPALLSAFGGVAKLFSATPNHTGASLLLPVLVGGVRGAAEGLFALLFVRNKRAISSRDTVILRSSSAAMSCAELEGEKGRAWGGAVEGEEEGEELLAAAATNA